MAKHRHSERHLATRASWLRAAVLGANDGLLSTASLLVGVAAADVGRSFMITAGVAALAAGACSMAVGEYSSVSSQRDVEMADLGRERRELATDPDAERRELAEIYRRRGLSPGLAAQVARELSELPLADVLHVHARDELGLDPNALANPAQAAVVSALSFTVGALLPLLVAILFPSSLRVGAIYVTTLLGLAALGVAGARLGGAPVVRAGVRVLVGGALAMLVTGLIGSLTGVALD